jgi:hypothetical protein
MKSKDYIATIRIHDNFRIKVTAFSEKDAWRQATRRVQDICYHDLRVGNLFVLTQVAIEEVEAKE